MYQIQSNVNGKKVEKNGTILMVNIVVGLETS